MDTHTAWELAPGGRAPPGYSVRPTVIDGANVYHTLPNSMTDVQKWKVIEQIVSRLQEWGSDVKLVSFSHAVNRGLRNGKTTAEFLRQLRASGSLISIPPSSPSHPYEPSESPSAESAPEFCAATPILEEAEKTPLVVLRTDTGADATTPFGTEFPSGSSDASSTAIEDSESSSSDDPLKALQELYHLRNRPKDVSCKVARDIVGLFSSTSARFSTGAGRKILPLDDLVVVYTALHCSKFNCSHLNPLGFMLGVIRGDKS